jgi:hypothetical protein
MRRQIHLRQLVLVCALCAGVAACSSSSSPAAAPPASSSAPAPSSAPASAAASSSAPPAPATTPASTPALAGGTPTEQKIAANWTAFFNPALPEATKIGLLQNATQLTSALKGLEDSATSKISTAKVLSVTMVSATEAKVKYDILLNGKPVLTNQSGIAYLDGGTWQVGTATLCGLLYLNAGGKSNLLPAACKTAG